MWELNSWNDWRRRGNGEGPNSWPPSARKRGLRLVNLWRSPSIRPGCTHSIQRQDSASGARLTGDSQGRRFVMHRKPTIMLLLAAAPVSYTHLRAHETKANLVCRLLLEKKK